MGAYALLVGISEFTDPRLAKLNAPRGDVEALAQVLKDPVRGGFDDVATCLDQDLQTIRDQLAALLDDRNPNDMVLLYYSGHGIMTKGQRLFLATGQSSFDRPQARSLAALEMRDMLEQSRAGKQVVILDCCHSGAFVDGAKGVAQTITGDTFGSDSAEGQYVLTATDALQYAYDANGTLHGGEAPAALSRFTGWLVDAIGKGQAAPDSEKITLDAVFDYLSRRARVEAAGMTPKRFVKRNSGEMVIARNPAAQPPKLPDELIAQLDSKDWQARRDAVAGLGKLVEQPAFRDLVEQAVTDRVSLERDIDVRGAMVKLLRRLGTDAPAPEPKPVPVTRAPEPTPIPMRSAVRASVKSDEDTPEPFWKSPKWLMLAGGVGLAVLILIGGIVAGVRSYQRMAIAAADGAAAEQARVLTTVEAEAAKRREADAAKRREAEVAKQNEAAAAPGLAQAPRNAEAPRQRKQIDVNPLSPEALNNLAPTKKLPDTAPNAAAPNAAAPNQREEEFQQLTQDIARQKALAAQTQQQLASMDKAAQDAIRHIAGGEFKDCAECPAMVTIPAGGVTMGSSTSESGRDRDESPQHRVTIPNPLAVGKYEVTFAEWDACVADGGCNGYKPDDGGWGRGLHPVVNVSWTDAQTYIAWLRRKTMKPYRLLSESEWEYAARAETVLAFYWGARASPASARYNASNGTAPVGSYAPNSFGLYDMSGNVSEWGYDCLNSSYDGAPADGRPWMTGNCDLHALRGGAWNSGPNNLRSANRDWDAAGFRVNRNGFRVARGL